MIVPNILPIYNLRLGYSPYNYGYIYIYTQEIPRSYFITLVVQCLGLASSNQTRLAGISTSNSSIIFPYLNPPAIVRDSQPCLMTPKGITLIVVYIIMCVYIYIHMYIYIYPILSNDIPNISLYIPIVVG